MTGAEQRIDATEYVLGLLDPQEKRAFELALLDDADLAGEVWQAEEELSPLGTALKERQPPARVARGLERTLFAGAEPKRNQGRFALAFWRGMASLLGVTTVAAAALAIVLLVRPDQIVTPVEPLLAGLVSPGGEVTLARVTPDGGLQLASFEGALPEGRFPELWYIDEDGSARSLGLMSAREDVTLPLPIGAEGAAAGARLDGLRLVVTDEPEGGAPGGVATGSVIAEGTLRAI